MQDCELKVAIKNTFLHTFKLVESPSDRPRSQSMPPLGQHKASGLSPIAFRYPSKLDANENLSEGSTTDSPMSHAPTDESNCSQTSERSKDNVEMPMEQVPISEGNYLTVMMRNIPCACTCQDVLDAIKQKGFEDDFNFFYLPLRRERENLGYAFVGFSDPDATRRFEKALTGHRFTQRNSRKVLSIVPAKFQGLKACIEHFKNTRTMMSKWPPIFRNTDGLEMILDTVENEATPENSLESPSNCLESSLQEPTPILVSA